MCVYGGGIPSPFDYGTMDIHMVCRVRLKLTSVSITTNT